MSKPKRVLVIPDTHVAPHGCKEGGADEGAISCLFKAIPIIKPDVCVHLGDVGEWASVSPFQWKRRKRPPVEYVTPKIDKDALAVNDFMNDLTVILSKAGCNEMHLIEGNHEVWLDNFVEEHPYLPQYKPENLLHLKGRGWKYHPYGEYIKFGRLYITHGGHFTSKHHACQSVTNTGKSILYGHLHSTQLHKISTLDGDRGAWCIGCLAKLEKRFLKGRPTSWSHAFAIVHIYGNNDFQVELLDIVGGKVNVWGNLVKA